MAFFYASVTRSRRSALYSARDNGYRFSIYGKVAIALLEDDLSLAFIGVYWRRRSLTLREYADFLRLLLKTLQNQHAVFSEVVWVGDEKQKPAPISHDMSNLDELVYRHSWSKRDLVGARNADGTATWNSENKVGFAMDFFSLDATRGKGISLSTRAGYNGSAVPNSVILEFALPQVNGRIPASFYDYDFILCLFSELLGFTEAKSGVVSSTEFCKKFSNSGRCDVGWLTYVTNKLRAANCRQLLIEDSKLPGTLFSLGKESIFVNSNETVDRARSFANELNDLEVAG